MLHALLIYAICGTGTALVIATVDLLTPKYPPMGTTYTLISGVLWPAFLSIAVVVVLKHRLKNR